MYRFLINIEINEKLKKKSFRKKHKPNPPSPNPYEENILILIHWFLEIRVAKPALGKMAAV